MPDKLLHNTQSCRFLRISVVLATLLVLCPVYAATLAGVNFPDQTAVEGKTEVLNGLGLRTATVFKVKVYVIGLYLEREERDPEAIIESDGNKRIVMHFVHDVTAEELSGGWTDGFADNTEDIAGIKGEIAKFNASMRDVKSGDRIVLDFSGDRVDVSINDKKIDSIAGKMFPQALLAIWLGPKPPNDALKEGILGR